MKIEFRIHDGVTWRNAIEVKCPNCGDKRVIEKYKASKRKTDFCRDCYRAVTLSKNRSKICKKIKRDEGGRFL